MQLLRNSTLIISKGPPVSPSMDYSILREEGIKWLQNLSQGLWTDHNAHDPGITILEILCYALTELGLRTNFDTEDLISSLFLDNHALFEPAEVLPLSPWTLSDIRKVLIDHPEVKNAYVSRASKGEIPLFWLQEESRLSLTRGELLTLEGLYNIQLEFSEETLNRNVFTRELKTDKGIEFLVDFGFPYWDQVPKEIGDAIMPKVELLNNELRPDRISSFADYIAIVSVEYNEAKDPFRLIISIKILDDILGLNRPEEAQIVDAIKLELENLAENSTLKNFFQHVAKFYDLIEEITVYLHSFRGIGEDFLPIAAIRTQEIAIDAELLLPQGADTEKVIADMFISLDSFFEPKENRLSWQAILDEENIKVSEVLEGPLPKNGFTQSSSSENQFVDSIFVSDLINLSLKINEKPGRESRNKILAIRDFKISNFINNQLIIDGERNCLQLPQSNVYLPRLSLTKSKIRVYKENVFVNYDIEKVLSKVRSIQEAEQTQNTNSHVPKFFPQEDKLDLGAYFSIQNDFPPIYGIGNGELSESSSQDRITQKRQLKAYLLLFDKILSDYLAQVANIGKLLGTDSEITTTYFSQNLSSVPELEELISNDIEASITTEEYILNLERRNRFLDFILGVFGEDLDDLTQISLSVNIKDGYETSTGKARALVQMIECKSIFLKEIAQRSTQISVAGSRAQGFHYLKNADELWNTENITGLEQRIGRIIGIKNLERRTLATSLNEIREIFTITADRGRYVAKLRNNGQILLQSIPYLIPGGDPVEENEAIEKDILTQIIGLGALPRHYRQNLTEGKRRWELINTNGEVIARSLEFDSSNNGQAELTRITEYLHQFHRLREGLHLVEHLLLRPRLTQASDDILLPPFAESSSANRDPYSFQLTINFPSGYSKDFSREDSTLLPSLPFRFRDLEFRNFVEKIVQTESPAHIITHVNWIHMDLNDPMMFLEDSLSLNRFEKLWKAWLTKNDPVNNQPLDQEELLRVNSSLTQFFQHQ